MVLLDLNGTSVDSHRIALMPARRYLPESDFVKFARLVEILSFRWVITGGNAQEFEEIYQDAAQLLHASRGEKRDEAENSDPNVIPVRRSVSDRLRASGARV